MAGQSKLQIAYREFFNAMLGEFGAKSIADLGDRKSEFFGKLKKDWAKKKKTIQEGVLRQTVREIITEVLEEAGGSYGQDGQHIVFMTNKQRKNFEKLKRKIAQNGDEIWVGGANHLWDNADMGDSAKAKKYAKSASEFGIENVGTMEVKDDVWLLDTIKWYK